MVLGSCLFGLLFFSYLYIICPCQGLRSTALQPLQHNSAAEKQQRKPALTGLLLGTKISLPQATIQAYSRSSLKS